MAPPTLSERIKQTNSANKDVTDITEKLTTTLTLTNEPNDEHEATENRDDSADEADWEKLAEEELKIPVEPVRPVKQSASSASILELYDFDPRIQMHELVKEFTKIVDSTGTMSFRPKMINQSLMLTFNNPNHGTNFKYSIANGSNHGVVQLFLHYASEPTW